MDENRSNLRTKLAPHLGHRVKIRGLLDAWRADQKGTRACVNDPEMDGEIISTHVWVLRPTPQQQWEAAVGQEVTFTAVVRDYHNADGRNYCLRHPSDLTLVNPPALSPAV
jgi:hypothetical protein